MLHFHITEQPLETAAQDCEERPQEQKTLPELLDWTAPPAGRQHPVQQKHQVLFRNKMNSWRYNSFRASKVHLELLNDVPVVRSTQRLLAWSWACRYPPVFGGSLHHGAVDFEGQSVDLTVQVHWDGYGPCLSLEKQADSCITKSALIVKYLSLFTPKGWTVHSPTSASVLIQLSMLAFWGALSQVQL